MAGFMANRYVPRPPDDQLHRGTSRPPSSVLIAALAPRPFFPHFPSYFDDPPVWTRGSVPAPLVRLPRPSPFVPRRWGATGDDSAFWTGPESYSVPPSLLALLQLYAPAPARFMSFDDPPVWVRVTRGVNLNLPVAAAPPPFMPGRWDFNLDDPAYSAGQARAIPNEIRQPAVVPAPFTGAKWRVSADDADAIWIRRQVPIWAMPQPAPLRPAAWDYAFDDAAADLRRAPIAPVQGLSGGGYPFKVGRWPAHCDDATVWVGRPGNIPVTLGRLLTPPLRPSNQWAFSFDDGAVWASDASSATLLRQQLDSPPPFMPRQWPIPGRDDDVNSVLFYNRASRARPIVIILNPNYIAAGEPRHRIAVGVSNAMSQTRTLQPPIDAAVENETVTFDFGRMLNPGVTLKGSPVVTCVAFIGIDADSASRLIGPYQIIASPNTCAPSCAVAQLVGTMVAGVTYRLQCVAETTDGQDLSLWTHLRCEAPN